MYRTEKIAFVTNFCSHYRVKTFESLTKYYDIDYYFFSGGNEWYWQKEITPKTGKFNYEYLAGLQIGNLRITPSLICKLWSKKYSSYIKCINGKFALPLTFIIARLRKKPFILWTGVWMRIQTVSHKIFFPLIRHIYRHADAIVCYGQHVKEYLVREGVESERLFIANHAVDNEKYKISISEDVKASLLDKLGVAPDKKIILYIGRLREEKGLFDLVTAIANMQRDDVMILFVGSGSYEDRLKELVIENAITESVRFIGHVPPDDTIFYYSIADVCVLSSITTKMFKEPWGLVVNEAFNQGVPVIVTNSVGAAAGGLVCDGINGIVIRERDPKALSTALNMLLDNPSLCQRMGQNALETISGWDNNRMVKGFRDALDFVLEK